MASNEYSLGVDLGGTKILAAVLRNGQVVATAKCTTHAQEGYDAVLERIATTVKSARKKAEVKRSDLRSLGIGVPGPVTNNMLLQAPNLGWTKPNLAADLARLTGIPRVLLANDVNCGTLGEATVGAGAFSASVFGLFVGTGLGGGWVRRGKVHEGQHGFSGEIGHLRVPGQTAPCGCGQTGCLETVASKRGITRLLREAVASGKTCAITDFDNLKSSALETAYLDGCPATLEAVRTVAEHLGWAITTIATVLDPALFVLSGGVAERLGKFMLTEIEATRQASPFILAHAPYEVRLGTLGGNAVAIGAAQLR